MRWAARFVSHVVGAPSRKDRRRRFALRVEPLEGREVPTVSGTAYIDLNLNGTQDAEDVGVAGVTVTATDPNGVTETATTGANGAYTLQSNAPNLRLEFSNLPPNTLPGRSTASTGGLVQFLTATSDRTGVDLPLAAPLLATTQFFYDDAVNGANADQGAVLAVPYGADSSVTPSVLANVSEVGSVWGLAYQPSSDSLYASSFLKRHAGLGPDAAGTGTTTGGIYKIDPTGTANPALLIDLNTAGAGLGTGADPHPTETDANGGDWYHDAATLPLVGKRGLGGLAMSADGRTLYTINLNTRELVEVPLNADGTLDTTRTIRHTPVPLTNPTGSGIANFNAADVRPFAVAVHNGAVFVGVTYTAETSQVASDLRAIVYTFNPAAGAFRAYNPQTGQFNPTPATTPVLIANLSYRRGAIDDPTPDQPNSGDEISGNWLPWTGSFPTTRGQDGFPVHPSPWLTGLAFDGNAMVLGIRDRFGDQGGYQTGNLTPSDTDNQYAAIASGDILRAAVSGTTGWTIESNGAAGGVTTGGAGNLQGPGGGEFYFQDGSVQNGTATVPQDATNGAVVQVPGFPTVASTGGDVQAAFTGGIYTFFNGATTAADGQHAAGTADTRTELYESSDSSTFGDANGLGGLAALPALGTVQVGDRVFEDTNGNGLQDAGEPGIAGVTVKVFQGTTQVEAVTTGTDGSFQVNDLQPNTAYELRIDPTQAALAGRTLALARQGADTLIDSNATLSGGNAVIALTTGEAGTSDNSLDFGFGAASAAPTLTLGNRVFKDANNNGTLDSGETGVSGVTVQLLDSTGANVLATTTTDSTGVYTFPGLAAGTYVVRLPATDFTGSGPLVGYTASSTVAADPNNSVDGDNNGQTVGALGLGGYLQTGPVTLAVGTGPTNDGDTDPNTNLSVDFGVVPPTPTLTLGDTVFNDTNNNGTFDSGETGIAGVTVQLLDSTGASVLQTAVTDGNGVYKFSKLAAGTYKVRLAASNFSRPGVLIGYTPSTTASANPDDNVNNDSNGSASGTLGSGGTVVSGPITLAVGAEPTNDGDTDPNTNLSLDFGMVPPPAPTLTLGDTVFKDANNNGTFDSGETGIAGVSVELLDSTGANVLQTTTTNSSGVYKFTGLAAGTYEVRLATTNFATSAVLGGYTPSTTASTSPDDNVNNDSNGTVSGTLGSGGFVVSGPITLAAGTEPTTDGDTDPNTNLTLDFGLVPPAAPPATLTLGNLVWNDANGNGAFDTLETGITGVTVQLLDSTGAVVQTTTTGTGGIYTFTGLTAGAYKVRLPATDFNTGGALANFTNTSTSTTTDPNDNVNNNNDGKTVGALGSGGYIESGTVNLALGQEPTNDGDTDPNTNLTVDFGLAAKASNSLTLGDRVWKDTNNNGKLDTGESGIGGVTLQLLNAAGTVLLTTTTDSTGTYTFTGLAAGSYRVRAVAANFQPGSPLAGLISSTGTNNAYEGANTPDPNNNTDNDDNGTTTGTLGTSTGYVQTGLITLAAGTEPTGNGNSNLTLDFGFTTPPSNPTTGSLAGRVFLDFNNSGTASGPDVGINGVTVTLSGGGLTTALTQQTDAQGNFTFSNLAPGTYTLTETQPTSPANQSGKVLAGNAGGTATASSNTISGIAITAGKAATGYTFAEVPLVTVSGAVFEDTNGNGKKDTGEPGIAGVTVTLTGTSAISGAVPATTAKTDTNGNYTFTGLTPGTYTVAETQPTGYTQGQQQNGLPAAATVTTDKFAGIDLTSLVAGVGYNFGEVKGASLAGTVFADANNDGVKAATGEPGIAGVKVRLTGTDDLGHAVDMTATTGSDGTYLFNSLRPGTYSLVETQPTNYADGKVTAGSAQGTTGTNAVTAIHLTSGTNATGYLFAEQPRADLALTQSPASTTISPGGTVTVTYTLTNKGTATATASTVAMNFAGLTFVSASTPSAFNSTTKVWTAGDLAAGATATIRITYKATAAGTYTPSATAATTATELKTTNNHASSTVSVGEVIPPPPTGGPLAWLQSRLWFLTSTYRRMR